MGNFPILVTVLSMVLGLSITRILLGVMTVFRIRRTAPPDWVALAWAFTIFLFQLEFWWALNDLPTFKKDFSFVEFLLLVSLTLSLFSAAALILPSRSEDAKLVVFDTRGNRGGNSLVGARILSALLGEAFVESLGQSSHSYAMWRVSPLALATLDSALASMQGNHEKNNDAYTFVSGMRESMNAALVGKQDWLRQPDTSSLDQGRVKDSSPVRFKGQLVLVTDSFCASAFLLACAKRASSILSKSSGG